MKDSDYALVVALLFSVSFNIPQLYKTYRSKNAKDLSTYTILMRLMCQTCWVTFAILEENWIILATTVQNIFTESLLLYMKLKYSKRSDSAET